MRCWSTMIPGEIFTGFSEFQGIVSVNDFRIPIGFQELLQASLGFLWSFFVLHGYAWIHWVAKSCTTTAYRWLLRDSQLSLRTLWSAVIKSPKFSARSTAPPLRLLHGGPCNFGPFADLAISVFREMSMNIVLTQILTSLRKSALKKLHEKNWRKNLRVLEFHHPPNFPWILAATPGSQNTTVRHVPSWVIFCFKGFTGLGIIKSPWSIINRIWHLHWRDVALNPIFALLTLNFTYCKWRRWGRRRWCGMTLQSRMCLWSWWRSGGRTRQAWNHDRNEVFRIADYPNPVLNEMWFLTIDPFVGIPVFIAKLSTRQCCWRVFEDFHSQKYIQFFDIHNCLFMRLHFSIGGYDYRRTARFRQSIHCSITQVLFADHMHWRTGVHNKFSFLKFKIWCKQAPIFRRCEECCSFMLL